MSVSRRLLPEGIVDRCDSRPFGEQIAVHLRQTIVRHVYEPGDILPSLRDIAAANNVSVRVVREAFLRLEQEGLVRTRQGIGCQVQSSGAPTAKGGTLLVIISGGADSCHANMLVAQIAKRMLAIGWSVLPYVAHRTPDGLDVSDLPKAEL